MFPYRILTEWSDADGCWVARVPALPNLAAHGDTASEAAGEAEKAGELMVDALGPKAPPPDRASGYSGNLRLRIPVSLHATLARTATIEGVSLNTILVSILARGATGEMQPAATPSPKKVPSSERKSGKPRSEKLKPAKPPKPSKRAAPARHARTSDRV